MSSMCQSLDEELKEKEMSICREGLEPNFKGSPLGQTGNEES